MCMNHMCKDYMCKDRVCKDHKCKSHICEDCMYKNQGGFSLVEIIIVIALLAVLAGSSVAMIGHIRYANTKKVVEEVDKTLSRLRLDTMSQKGERQFLYIYRLDNNGSAGYYFKLVDEDTKPNLDGNGTRLCGTNVTFSADGNTISGDKIICIVFKKNGQLDSGTNADKIVISGTGTYTITLDKETGKHLLE